MKTHTYQVSWLQLVLLLLPAVRSTASDFSQRIAVLDSLSLPLVNLIVDTALMGNSHFTSGRIAIIDPLRWAGGQQVSVYDCQLRYRGNWALNYEKKSFAVKLTDSSGKKLDVSVLGIRDENSWILDAMSFDCMRMRNRVCFDLWNSFSRIPGFCCLI